MGASNRQNQKLSMCMNKKGKILKLIIIVLLATLGWTGEPIRFLDGRCIAKDSIVECRVGTDSSVWIKKSPAHAWRKSNYEIIKVGKYFNKLQFLVIEKQD